LLARGQECPRARSPHQGAADLPAAPPNRWRQALLAGASFNGEVLLWDLSRDRELDPQLAKSDALGEARHREPVTALVSACGWGGWANVLRLPYP
jgi:hypothetical protein